MSSYNSSKCLMSRHRGQNYMDECSISGANVRIRTALSVSHRDQSQKLSMSAKGKRNGKRSPHNNLARK